MDIPSFNVNGQQEVGSGEGRDSDQGKVVERLGELEVSSERWKSRVGEHDANEFTVANKLCSQSGHKLCMTDFSYILILHATYAVCDYFYLFSISSHGISESQMLLLLITWIN